ncbi:hypothetical protein [Kitasatospora indigofera]|uniref:hypothetical protein n=1 Tax=Kitasatospora indigofera TaxID=67307 RepID=UPI0036BEDFF1
MNNIVKKLAVSVTSAVVGDYARRLARRQGMDPQVVAVVGLLAAALTATLVQRML